MVVIFRGEEVTGSRRLCKYSHIASLHLELTQDVNVEPCVKKLRAAPPKRDVFQAISPRFWRKISALLTANDAAGVSDFVNRFSVD